MAMEGMGVLGGAPRFLRFPRPVRVVSGTDAILRCCLTGSPPPTVLWEKDGQALEASSRLRLQTEGAEHSLLVRGAGAPDAGVYVCRAQNSSGEAYAAAALTIQEQPPDAAPIPAEGSSNSAEESPSSVPLRGPLPLARTLSPLHTASTCLSSEPAQTHTLPQGIPGLLPEPLGGSPMFLEGPQSQWVQQGEEVVLTCRVRGQPEPAVHWEKDGRLLEDIWESSHFCLAEGPVGAGVHELRIRGIRLPDAGVYVCHASNTHGHVVAAALLQIQPSPDAPLGSPRQAQRDSAGQGSPAPKSFWVSEGKHAKFRCYVTGKPEPETEWHWEGHPLSPGRRRLLYRDRDGGFVLKVLYCQPADCGLYVCAARNTAGHTLSAVQLHVREPRVRFAVPLEDVEGEEHGDAVLECQVPSRGITTTWYREDQRLLPSPKYEMGEAGVIRRLIIHDLEADDDGIYLCEMRGRVRTVATVAVRGPIRRRLPRKLDVLEGENAVLSVEVGEAEVLGHWTRDGQELPASPRILQTSSNHTHTLVLVGVTRQDAGVVTFSLGPSHTSSRLRVKCVKQVPPGPPVAVELGTGGSNAALLSWKPPVPTPDTAYSYRLERQEVGTDAWAQCLTTEAAGAVEVPGDSVPTEGDYRFRLSVVSEHGQSPYILFPGSVHLVPTARVQRALQDVCVREGDDATFFLELSTAVQGTWFLNGTELKAGGPESQGYLVQQQGTQHNLLLRATRLQDSGTLVTFLCPGVHVSATLHVQEPPVRIVLPQEKVSIEAMSPERLVLTCELSRAGAPVHWYKDGLEIEESKALILENEGLQCRLVIPAAQPQHGGEFVCQAGEDSAFFMVTIKEPPVRIIFPQEEVSVAAESSERVVLRCELSRAGVPVLWSRDGMVVKESDSLVLEREGPCCLLTLPSAQPQDGGRFVCEAGDNLAVFNVTITEPPVRIVQPQDEVFLTAMTSERVVLMCQVSRPGALVGWYKNGMEVKESKDLVLESEGLQHRLVLPAVRPQDGGEFVCSTRDDSAFFTVTVTDPPVRIISPQDTVSVAALSSEPVVLMCELSRAGAPVRWYKDGLEVEESKALVLESEGPHHRLVLPAAQPQDGGEFVCKAGEDSAFFKVTITEPPVRILFPQDEVSLAAVSSERVILMCELSRAGAPVRWYKDGLEVEESEALVLESEGPHHRLVLPAAQPQDGGEFVCDAGDDSAFFLVTVTVPPERIVRPSARFLQLQFRSPGRVELRCEVAPVGARVCWYKDGLEVEASEDLKLGAEGPVRTLTLPHARPEDAGEYVCETRDEAVSFDVRLAESPVQFLLPEVAPSPLSVSRGEQLVLSCELSRASAPVFWNLNGSRVLEDGNLELRSEGPRRLLLIRAAHPSHSGNYTCQAGSDPGAPTLTFPVQVTEPPVRVLTPEASRTGVRCAPGRDLELAVCLSGPGGAVRWYKDGERLASRGRVRLEEAGARRVLRVRGARSGDAGEYLCDAPQDSRIFLVNVEEPPQVKLVSELTPLTIQEGDDATFRCEVSPPDAEITWLLNGTSVTPSSRVEISQNGPNHTLTLQGCRMSDSGMVTARTTGAETTARLHVREAELLFLRRLQDVRTEEGQDLCMEVETSRVGVKGIVSWFRGGKPLPEDDRFSVVQDGRVHRLIIRKVTVSDQGIYSCKSHHDRTQARLLVRPEQLKVRHRLEDVVVTEGGSATFQLELSQSGVVGEWARGGVRLEPGRNCQISAQGHNHSLVLSGLGLADTGTVSFTTDTLRCAARLEVKEIPLAIVRGLQDLEVMEGDSATFECELSRTQADLTWDKDGQELSPSPRLRIQALGSRRLLQLRHCSPADAGTYRCSVGNAQATTARLTVLKREVSVLLELKPVRAREGDGATFKCTVSEPDIPGCWQLGGRILRPGGRVRIRQEGNMHSLMLNELQAEDSGEIQFQAGQAKSSTQLEVEALPLQICRKPPREKTVLAGRRAALEVTVSRAGGHVRWLLGGVDLPPGPKYEFRSHGVTHSLIIHNVQPTDEGTYCCQAGEDSASTNLLVESS
ncbi:obscurin-like protein 1 isoform X1 [Dromiciops gliroides]|uniref:obscurin-like protein 1 isoform X1 n=1 Tax=Dromiciops gliroides TaxID=33562 RepID=UPI001CC7C275|nr:obscurin-like protein 1 isoform X1 [Dromiciops gliroides]